MAGQIVSALIVAETLVALGFLKQTHGAVVEGSGNQEVTVQTNITLPVLGAVVAVF